MLQKLTLMTCFLGYLLTTFTDPLKASEVLSELAISEETLRKLANKKNSPTSKQIRGKRVGEDLKYTSIREIYSPNLFYQTQYMDKAFRNRKSLSSMQDGAQVYHQVGVRQALPYGIGVEAIISNSTSRTNLGGFLPQMAGTRKEVTSSVELKASFDIWKNLTGKIDQSRLNSFGKGKKIGELKEKVDENQFKINLRKIYWRLVANKKSSEISQKLLKTSTVNAANVAARKRESLADVGDVARSNAAVSSRRGTLLSLEFEKENLVLTLKNMLPELENYNLRLTDIDLDQYIGKVMVCIGAISDLKSIPLEDTYFKEISELINQKLEDDLKIDKSHDQMDVKVVSSIYRDGQDRDFSGSKNDFNKKERTDYSVGIMVEIPLGSKKGETKENKLLLQKLMSESESRKFENEMRTTHHFIVNSIQILVKAMQEQRGAKKDLDIRLKSMRKKYQQGRISINELMADEDQLLNVELAIVKTQLLIVETLLSYFEVFNRFDCPFNKF